MPYYCQRCGYFTKYKGMFKYHITRKTQCTQSVEAIQMVSPLPLPIANDNTNANANDNVINNIIKTFTTPCIFGWEQTWHIEEPFLNHVNSLEKTIGEKIIIIAQELFLSNNMPQNRTIKKNNEATYLVHTGFGKWAERKKDIIHEKIIEKASDVFIAFLESIEDEVGAYKVSENIENEIENEQLKESVDDMLTIVL